MFMTTIITWILINLNLLDIGHLDTVQDIKEGVMKNHGFKSVFEVCAALLAQYIAFYMISSRLGKEAEIENFLTNKFVMIFWVIYLTNKFIRSSKTKK